MTILDKHYTTDELHKACQQQSEFESQNFFGRNKMKTIIVPANAIGVSVISVIALGIALLLTGCGTNNSTSSNSNLSAAQAQSVASAMSSGFSQALAGAFGSASATARAKVTRADGSHPNLSGPTCSPTSSGESCNWPISETFTCPGGGTLSVSGDVNGFLDGSGDGSVQEQIGATPANCSIDGIVINGNPQVTASGQLNISNWNPDWPLTGTETGGVTYGPNPSGSCQINVNFTVNSDLSCSVSGTVCGQPVSSSC
jgi:hypothetical protein